jgi:hypothetical protein
MEFILIERKYKEEKQAKQSIAQKYKDIFEGRMLCN